MSDTDGKLQLARECLQSGDMRGAEQACAEVLELLPGDPGATLVLGLVRASQGRLAEAVAALKSAAASRPDDAAVHAELGATYARQGRHGEAVASFGRAVELDPDSPGLYLNLGNALAEQGRNDEALACYRNMLALKADLAVAHFSIGKVHERAGRLSDAQAAYQAALEISPEHTGALHNLGAVHQKEGRHDAAASCYRRALALDPAHVPALNNLGSLLAERGQRKEAASLFEKAIECQPGEPLAFINLARLRATQGDYAAARAMYDQALRLDPGNLSALVNLGTALSEQQLWDEATARYERALELDPSRSDALYNLGLVRLFQHRFDEGWPAYEHRLWCPGTRNSLRKGAETLDLYERLARWRGPGESGIREVGIWAEQGIGDQTLFSTLIPELVAADVPFLYEVDPRLLGAYERAFPGSRFVALSKPPRAPLREAQRVLLAGSLPGLFRRGRADFERQPARLLGALPDRVAHYRERIGGGPGTARIALSWRSKSLTRSGVSKSAALMAFAPLFELRGARFVDVQYGDTRAERRWVEEATGARLAHFDEVHYYNDLEAMLAILEACDLLITTSNATAHFAGALGKRTWLLYPGDRPPFYYWAHGGSRRSLWYPAVEIVTAPALDEWVSLIRHAAERLESELT